MNLCKVWLFIIPCFFSVSIVKAEADSLALLRRIEKPLSIIVQRHFPTASMELEAAALVASHNISEFKVHGFLMKRVKGPAKASLRKELGEQGGFINRFKDRSGPNKGGFRLTLVPVPSSFVRARQDRIPLPSPPSSTKLQQGEYRRGSGEVVSESKWSAGPYQFLRKPYWSDAFKIYPVKNGKHDIEMTLEISGDFPLAFLEDIDGFLVSLSESEKEQ